MSPAAGRLGTHEDWLKRVIAYAQGGAAAVSVLTEPSRFDGSLEHLRQASAALAPFKVPTMRKDFLVDPYQVLEARAAGAGGVLLIVRMLSRSQMLQLLDAAAEHGLFVLLEAFDLGDLHAARELLAARIARRAGVVDEILVGINSRDLQTLEVVPERFEATGAAAAARSAGRGGKRRRFRGRCRAHEALRVQAGADRYGAHEPR